MKKNTVLVFMFFGSLISAQVDYSVAIFGGPGINIYDNSYETDKRHFKFKNSFSGFIGVRLTKALGEMDHLFMDAVITRKKIEYEYKLNEPEIPFNNKDIIGQKYNTYSIYFGYKRIIPSYILQIYFESSVGADYNRNVVFFGRGNGSFEDAPPNEDSITYESIAQTNLGESNITMSGNLGFGINVGKQNQFDIGLIFNFPFQKIQSKVGTFDMKWEYERKQYRHHLEYLGNVYYPALKITYYIF